MSAAEITETNVGVVAPHVQISGTGLKMAVYTATKATANDWVILGDFEEIKECVVYLVSAGARSTEYSGFTVDATTKNKVVLTGTGTGSASIVAIGF